MDAGYEQRKLKAQDGKPLTEREREREENCNEATRPRRLARIADQRKNWLSAGCCLLHLPLCFEEHYTRLDLAPAPTLPDPSTCALLSSLPRWSPALPALKFHTALLSPPHPYPLLLGFTELCSSPPLLTSYIHPPWPLHSSFNAPLFTC